MFVYDVYINTQTHTVPRTHRIESRSVKIKSNPTKMTNPNANGMENIIRIYIHYTHSIYAIMRYRL